MGWGGGGSVSVTLSLHVSLPGSLGLSEMCCAGQSTHPGPVGGEGLPAERPAEPQLPCCVMGLNRDDAYSRCSARYGKCMTRTLDRAMRSCWAPALGQACLRGPGAALLRGQHRLEPVAQNKSHERTTLPTCRHSRVTVPVQMGDVLGPSRSPHHPVFPSQPLKAGPSGNHLISAFQKLSSEIQANTCLELSVLSLLSSRIPLSKSPMV